MPRHRSNQPRGRGGPWAVVAASMLAARASATPAPSPNGMCTAPTYATNSCSALGGVCVTESSCSGTHTAEGCGETPACGCCFRTPAPSPVDTDDDAAVPRFHDTIILFTIAVSTALFGLYYLVLVLRVPNKHDAPFRQRLTAYASNSVLGTVLDLINAAYSFISCVFFVWDTYLTRPPIWMFALEVRGRSSIGGRAIASLSAGSPSPSHRHTLRRTSCTRTSKRSTWRRTRSRTS